METARLYAHTAGRVIYIALLFVWPYAAFPFWKVLLMPLRRLPFLTLKNTKVGDHSFNH